MVLAHDAQRTRNSRHARAQPADRVQVAYTPPDLQVLCGRLRRTEPKLERGVTPMPRTCSVCENPNRDDIDNLLVSGQSLRDLSLIHISEPTRLGMISYA